MVSSQGRLMGRALFGLGSAWFRLCYMTSFCVTLANYLAHVNSVSYLHHTY